MKSERNNNKFRWKAIIISLNSYRLRYPMKPEFEKFKEVLEIILTSRAKMF